MIMHWRNTYTMYACNMWWTKITETEAWIFSYTFETFSWTFDRYFFKVKSEVNWRGRNIKTNERRLLTECTGCAKGCERGMNKKYKLLFISFQNNLMFAMEILFYLQDTLDFNTLIKFNVGNDFFSFLDYFL
jgi:hypothetical protein